MIANIFKKSINYKLDKFFNLSAFVLILLFSVNVNAQEAAPAVSSEVAYILNTFLFLVCGFLVMFMAAGFCMLEAGQVRSKNTAIILCTMELMVDILVLFLCLIEVPM